MWRCYAEGVPPAARIVAATVAAVLLVSGCDAAVPAASPTPAEAGNQIRISAVPGVAIDRPSPPATSVSVTGLVAGLGEGLGAYLDQDPEWADCDDGTECAQVLAPLDYSHPGDRALTLSLRRKPATKSPRLGTLFINPGGPGASGKELVDRFESDGLEQYDIVGWDPRGTGDSTPVRCWDDAATDAFNNLDMSPDNDAERVALIQGARDFGDACWQNSGTLLQHISTIETVRDLDLLRQLLGDKKLRYLGYSYGTQIGATYAELFPQNTGRLVLDAAVNITDSDDVIQAMGFDLALGNFAAWCAEQDCTLGSSKKEVLAATTDLFDALDTKPLKVGSRRLTQSLAVTGVAALLYGGKDAWPGLEKVIAAGISGQGAWLLQMADALNSRDENGNYDTMFYAFPAISCLDTGDERGVLDADELWVEDAKKAPIFGHYFGPQYSCPLWPVRPARQLQIRGVGAAPLLVIGGTGDNATPYQQAVSMADQLDSGVLVTYEGEGHGSFGGKSTCIDRIVVSYLVKGTVPADGVRCS